jgi:sialate O-acetylesterase
MIYFRLRWPAAALFLLALGAPTAKCEVRLPRILSSHMVLQRDQPIHIWGWSEPNEKVSAMLNGASQSTAGDNLGRWSLYLPPQSAGGPFQLTVTGTNEIKLDDILIGDVWFASGQSNMEMPLEGFRDSAAVKNSAQEISQANQPQIRLLLIPRKASSFPVTDFDAGQSWTTCSPEMAAKFSAVAYFFGRDIEASEHVPIGLIDSTWGGTPAEAWLSLDALSSDASLMPVFAAWARMSDEQAESALSGAAEKREDAAARNANQPLPKHDWHPDPQSWDPSWLFNGMVAPFTGYPIKGVIWYQGESNSRLDRAAMYGRVFPALIADWRKHWHEGDFPFLFVQISSFTSNATEDWAAIREAQRRSLSVANSAMAVSIDVGDPDNVHPADKQSVGARLALAARALAYLENIEYSGPLFRQASTEPGAIRVRFDHVANGLIARGGPLEGFQIAGDDRRFVTADARIDGSSVIVSSPQVQKPKYVRYGWKNAPVANLYNTANLPASPFTSEDNIPVSGGG